MRFQLDTRSSLTARDDILDAADALFGDLGFDATTTRQIAERCGVNKALIHYHFDTKEQLFQAVLTRYYASLTQVFGLILVGELTIGERLELLVDTYVDFLSKNQRFSRMVQREVSMGRHVEQIVGHMVPPFRGALEVIHHAFPATKQGDFAAPQMLLSFFGMVVTYFAYGPVVEKLLGTDPFAPVALAARKRHLRRVLNLLIAALEDETEAVHPATP